MSLGESTQDFDDIDIFSLARHGRYGRLKEALEAGIDVESRDDSGNTILLIGAQNDNKLIVKLALQFGADVNSVNFLGNSCIHFCSEF